MDLKGSKTEKNLMAAFAGESMVTEDSEVVFITENEMTAAEVEEATKSLEANGVKVLAQYPVLVS